MLALPAHLSGQASSLARLEGVIEGAGYESRQDFEWRGDEISRHQRSAEPGLQTVEAQPTVGAGRDR
jgi:hypothetical protein